MFGDRRINDNESPQATNEAADFLNEAQERSELLGELDATRRENVALRAVVDGVLGVASDVTDRISRVHLSSRDEGLEALHDVVRGRALAKKVADGFSAMVDAYADAHSPTLEVASDAELRSNPDLQAEVEEAARKQVLEQKMGQATTARAVELAHEQELDSARQEAFGGLGIDMESLPPETKVAVKLGNYEDADQTTALTARTVEFIAHGEGEFEVVADSGAETEGEDDTRYTVGELVLLGRQTTRKGEHQFRSTVRAGAELCVDRDAAEPGHEIVPGGYVVDMSIDDKPLRQLQEIAPSPPVVEAVVDDTRATFEYGVERDIDFESIFKDFNSNGYVDLTGLPYNTQIELWLGASDYVQEGDGTRIKHRIRASTIGDGRFYISNLDELLSPQAVDANYALRSNASLGLRFCVLTHRGFKEALMSDAPLRAVGGAYRSEDGIYEDAFSLGERSVVQNIVIASRSAKPTEHFYFDQ